MKISPRQSFGSVLPTLLAALSFAAAPCAAQRYVPPPIEPYPAPPSAAKPPVPFAVPIYHAPASPSVRSFSTATSTAIRANWVPLCDEAGLCFAFENHDHAYKVTHPLRAGKSDPAGTRYLATARGPSTRARSSRPTRLRSSNARFPATTSSRSRSTPAAPISAPSIPMAKSSSSSPSPPCAADFFLSRKTATLPQK